MNLSIIHSTKLIFTEAFVYMCVKIEPKLKSVSFRFSSRQIIKIFFFFPWPYLNQHR